MWIRSQNKEVLVLITSAYVFKKSKKEFRIEALNDCCVGNRMDDFFVLGTYQTKERALEVLDSMQEAIAACEIAKSSDDIKSVVKALNEKQFASVAVGLFIYQMPEE